MKMRRLASVVLALLLAVSVGCYPSDELAELESRIEQLEDELAEKDVQVEDLEEQLLQLQQADAEPSDQNDEATEEPDELQDYSLGIRIDIRPDPIPTRRGGWVFRAHLEEINGVRVQLDSIVMETFHGDTPYLWADQGWLEAIDSSLSAHQLEISERYIPYREEATQVAFSVTGVDEDGQPVKARATATLLPAVPGKGEIEITFDPNPVPCRWDVPGVPPSDRGFWRWRVVFTELGGTGVELQELEISAYSGDRLLSTREYDKGWIRRWLFEAYLRPNGRASFGAGYPCQDVTHEVYVVTGIDDNGNEITATGRIDFER